MTGVAAPPTGTDGADREAASRVPSCPTSLRPEQNTCASVACSAQVKELPTLTARQGNMAGGVEEGEGVKLGVPGIVPETVGEEEEVGVTERLGVALGVYVAEGVTDCEGVRVLDNVAVKVVEGEEPALGVPVPLPELLGVAEGVRLSVGDTDGVALPERVMVGVMLLEGEVLLVSVGDREAVGEADGVTDGVLEGLLPAEGVPVFVPTGSGLCVAVKLSDALDEGLASMVAEDESLAPTGEVEGVEPSVAVALGVAVLLGVREGDAVGEGEAEGGASAYTLCASANTTELGASMGAPIMGRAAGVVKFHSSPPLALIARMEPPAVPSTLSPAACAAVTPATGEPAVLTTHTTSPVVRLSAKALLPHSAST